MLLSYHINLIKLNLKYFDFLTFLELEWTVGCSGVRRAISWSSNLTGIGGSLVCPYLSLIRAGGAAKP
jgi:hypothetical protein